jgi:hypothetical protein
MLRDHVVEARDRSRRRCNEVGAIGILARFGADEFVRAGNVRRDFPITEAGLSS